MREQRNKWAYQRKPDHGNVRILGLSNLADMTLSLILKQRWYSLIVGKSQQCDLR